MIKSSPINDKAEQKVLCAAANIPYDPAELAYLVESDEERRGILTFVIRDTVGVITHIAELSETVGDGTVGDVAFFIAARGALNFLDLHGVHEAYFDNVEQPQVSLAKMIGFAPDSEGRYYMNLNGFFTHGQHKK